MAIDARPPEGTLIHHSDRGGQYTSDDFRNELARHGMHAFNTGAREDTIRLLEDLGK